MHPACFFGSLSILLAPVKDRLFTWLPDVIWLFLRFHCGYSFPHCSAAWEGWVGSVSAKHFYISPIKSNVIVGAGLSLEFLQSVPKIIFCRSSEDQGQGRRAGDGLCCILGSRLPHGSRPGAGGAPTTGLPYLPRLRRGAAVVATHFSVAAVAS